MTIAQKAYAKINLSLNITGKRSNGYHELHSLIAFADVDEWVSAKPSDLLTLSISGAFASALSTKDNLVLTVAKAFQQHIGTRQGAALHLHKMMPVASGIGGGSSDAAAALHCLNHVWGSNLPLGTLQEFTLPFGADIPVCLYAKPCIMEGIGETITPCDELQPLHAVLVNPLKAIATQQIFKSLPPIFEQSNIYNSNATLTELSNDLQPHAIQQCAEVQHIIDALSATDGCICARMSGSGATCFGLFESQDEAQRANRMILDQFSSFWVRTTSIC